MEVNVLQSGVVLTGDQENAPLLDWHRVFVWIEPMLHTTDIDQREGVLVPSSAVFSLRLSATFLEFRIKGKFLIPESLQLLVGPVCLLEFSTYHAAHSFIANFFSMHEHLFAAFQFHPQWCGVLHNRKYTSCNSL